MSYLVKELRKKTKLTQKQFAEKYEIPLSTLRKWEQGEAQPADYVVNLIARTLPSVNSQLYKLQGKDGQMYYYDHTKKSVIDSLGTELVIGDCIEKVKQINLIEYLDQLFADYYQLIENFENKCHTN